MNYNRFKNTFAWMAANGYKRAVRSAIGMFFALLLVYCINLGLSTNETHLGEYWELSMMENAAGLTFFIVLMVFVVCAGNHTSYIRTNDSRVMALMLPADNKEKFLAGYLWTLVSLTAVCAAAIICADLARVIISYLAGWCIHSSLVITCIKQWCVGGAVSTDHPFLIQTWLWLMLAGAHATFVLGGTFFRRQPILMTMIAIFAIASATGIAISIFCSNVPAFFEWFVTTIKNLDGVMSETVWLLILNLLTLGVIALEYWAAYKLFCRIQIISNKWINV